MIDVQPTTAAPANDGSGIRFQAEARLIAATVQLAPVVAVPALPSRGLALDALTEDERAAMLGELYYWLGASARRLAALRADAALVQAAPPSTYGASIAEAVASADAQITEALTRASALDARPKKCGDATATAWRQSAPPSAVWDRLCGRHTRWLLVPVDDAAHERARREILESYTPPIGYVLGRYRAVRDLRAALETGGPVDLVLALLASAWAATHGERLTIDDAQPRAAALLARGATIRAIAEALDTYPEDVRRALVYSNRD